MIACATLFFGGLTFVDMPALARPGAGYGDLVDTYCIERGRLRVRAHQGHCAMCHHLGTFDVAPEHRVEPNWTEYERGRANGSFEFFCPGAPTASADAGMAAPSGSTAATDATSGPSPPTPRREGAGEAGPMGLPPRAAAPGPPASEAARTAGTTPKSSETGSAAMGGGQSLPALSPSIGVSVDAMARLAALHDAAGIALPQEGAWREFVDAVAAAGRIGESAPSTGDPASRIKARERGHSERISALRAVGTALSRLGAVLDEKQKRTLDEGLAPLLDAL